MSLRADIDRGLQIVDQIEMLERELKAIEARVEATALQGEQVELVDAEREGRQYLARGSVEIVPVIFTADLLVKSFADRSATFDRIATSTPRNRGALTRFFQPVSTWKTLFESGKEFRAKAAEILGADAPAFVSACLQRDKHGIPKSQTKIEWGRAEKFSTADNADGKAVAA